MPRNRRLGANAEDAAAEFVASLGYTIITRNYHGHGAEIDVIAMDGEVIVFFEVRERRRGGWMLPEETVDAAKQRRLWLAAEGYLSRVAEKEMPARFDVIAFEGEELRHHIDAFRPVTKLQTDD